MLPTEMKLCWRMLGTATTAISRRISPENQRWAFWAGMVFSRRSRASTASTQLTPWQRKVAQATPSTPMPKHWTNTTSRKMLAVEEAARKRKGVRESPMAEKMPVAIL